MRYISDDGKIFDIEQECLKHEVMVREKEAKEELDKLKGSIAEYRQKYGNTSIDYSNPLISNFARFLIGLD